MRSWASRLLAALLLGLLLVGQALAGQSADPLWQAKSQAQRDWQNALAELLMAEEPEAAEVIVLHRDMQLLLIALRDRRYAWLLEYDPGRIRTDAGYAEWSNFEWTGEEDAALAAADPDYAAMVEREEALDKALRGHPQMSALREVFANVTRSEAYAARLAELNERLATIVQQVNERGPLD